MPTGAALFTHEAGQGMLLTDDTGWLVLDPTGRYFVVRGQRYVAYLPATATSFDGGLRINEVDAPHSRLYYLDAAAPEVDPAA